MSTKIQSEDPKEAPEFDFDCIPYTGVKINSRYWIEIEYEHGVIISAPAWRARQIAAAMIELADFLDAKSDEEGDES